jgi:hypothetical protein
VAALKLGNFSGISPRTAERLLVETAAQVAENVNLTSGEIRPLRNPSAVLSAPEPLSVYRAVQNGATKWRTWQRVVSVAKGPLPVDVEARYYWAGDGEPRYALFANFDALENALGVPTPLNACDVAVVGGTGSTTTRFYCYTFVTALSEESAPSKPSDEVSGPLDGTWNISDMSDVPANSGTVTGSTSIVAGALRTTFNNTFAHWLRPGDEVVIDGDTLEVYSTPTPATFLVTGDYSAETAWARKAAWNTAGMTKRLYRTTGTLGSFQLVAEGLTGSTYSDTLGDADILGDDLISQGWVPPPAKMRGLGVLPSGAGFGYVNNILCFSEPNQLHAWPTKYQLSADHPIVGVAAYSTVVVAATTSKPHMADGLNPAVATFNKVDSVWPCLSERSVASVGDAVVYATSFGLAMIGLNGSSIMTEPFFTELEWKERNPSSMICAYSESRLFVRWQVGDESELMLFKMGEAAPLTTSSISCDALYVDPLDGELYITRPEGVLRFDADAGPRVPFTWHSKVFELPKPINLGALRLDFRRVLSVADEAALQAIRDAAIAYNIAQIAAYGGAGGFNGSAYNTRAFNGGPYLRDVVDVDREYLDFELLIDDEVIYSSTFLEPESVKLPAGYLTHHFSFRLRGNVRVLPVRLAETMTGLSQV